MYDYFLGNVTEKGTNYCVLESNNIGYFFYVSAHTLNKLDGGVKLFAHLLVREDEMSLYGFISKEEREMFLRLISVSGIGPKVAMNILSDLTPSDLALAIISADEKVFKKISGVGTKSAQRIILELKGKIDLPSADITIISEVSGDGAISEAVSALMALGYDRSVAVSAVAKVSGETADEVIFNALKNMGGAR